MRKISLFVIAAATSMLAGTGAWIALTPARGVKHEYPWHHGSIPIGRHVHPMLLDRRPESPPFFSSRLAEPLE